MTFKKIVIIPKIIGMMKYWDTKNIGIIEIVQQIIVIFNPLTANITIWSNTLKQFACR